MGTSTILRYEMGQEPIGKIGNMEGFYIAHFKTSGTKMGKPYDFQLKDLLKAKAVVDKTIAPGHPKQSKNGL